LTASLAAEIRRDRNWMLALGTLDAEQRVALFLQDLSRRYQAMGFSPSHFVLRMTRAEIGSFLALKHETVTRALSHLAALGIIAVERREVRIQDADALARLAGGSARSALAPLSRIDAPERVAQRARQLLAAVGLAQQLERRRRVRRPRRRARSPR
jgi:DNA-binding transcriptional regulator LsrR (DeoR family)